MKLSLTSFKSENLRMPNLEINFEEGMNFLQLPNGTGKTTLLKLVRHTLSNDWGQYESNYIKSFKRKDSEHMNGMFSIAFNFNNDKYAISAHFDFLGGSVRIDTDTPDGRKREQFKVPRELRPFLTKHHVDIFVFSAQMANTHFQSNSASVKNAVGTFSGRLGVERLQKELQSKFRAKHRGVTADGATKKLEDLIEELDKKKQNIKDLSEAYEEKLKPLQDRHAELSNKVAQNKGQIDLYKSRRETIEAGMSELRPKIADYENKIEMLAASPANISKKFQDMTEDVFSNLEKAKLPGIANLFFDEISEQDECICGTPITSDLKREILSRKKNYLDTDDVGFINEMKANIKNAVDDAERDELNNILNDATEAMKQKKDLEEENEDLHEEQKRNALSEREINEFDKLGDDITSIQTELEKMKTSKYDGEKNHINKERDLLPLRPDQIREFIDNMPDAEWLHSKHAEKHAEATGYQNANANMVAMEDIISSAIDSAENKIKTEITHSMNKMIGSIHTDQDFRVNAIDDKIYLDGQEEGSGAQEVITVSAFALSLLGRSSVDFPMLIDHPVKDIQNEDRAELSKFLSNTSHQCICLVINSEKDGFTRDEETREKHDFLSESNFITAVRAKNAPEEMPEDHINHGDGISSYDYDFFDSFRTSTFGDDSEDGELDV